MGQQCDDHDIRASERHDAGRIQRATEVTYLGTVYGTMAALSRMHAAQLGPDHSGRLGARLPVDSLQAAYCGAKHAIAGFTDSLRTELIHENRDIHLTMVQFPAMNTPQFTGAAQKCRVIRSPFRLYSSRKSPQSESSGHLITNGAKYSSACRRWSRSKPTRSRQRWRISTSVEPASILSRRGTVAKDRPDNLFEPLPGDFGAHGIFEPQAHEQVATTWFADHKGVAALAGAAALGVVAFVFRKMSMRKKGDENHKWLRRRRI